MPSPAEHFQTFDDASLAELAALLAQQRQAALATLHAGAPYTAMVAYAPEPGWSGFLVHLSDLSAHKAQLRADPRASLLICQPDDGRREVLTHQRLSLACRAAFVGKDSDAYAVARTVYLARFPAHQLMFTLKDFDLVCLTPSAGLFNAGFGRAYPVTPTDLSVAAGFTVSEA